MKKGLMLISFMVLAIVAANAQSNQVNPADAKTPVAAPKQDILILKEPAHNFGKIPQGRPTTHNFEITNTGKEPLRLENVQASCGCTTPEWSKEPIAPGANATIKVGYNAYAEGAFTKVVTIFYNGNQTKTLTITGEVYKSP